MDDDEDVGYGKPPKRTQFKKGQSGNPNGRPKGRKNMRTVLNEILDRKVTITENESRRSVPFFEAFMHQLAAKGLNGSLRDQIRFLETVDKYFPEQLENDNIPTKVVVEFVDTVMVLSDDECEDPSERSDRRTE